MFEQLASMIGLSQNCWFCNKYSFVSPWYRNSWTCTHCEQYNGFNENGDYNKVIPEMYKSSRASTSAASIKINWYPSNAFKNEMCFKCNLNQQKKIKKLSQFEPTSEKTFDIEYAIYKDSLEKLFDLCETCKPRTRFWIAAQNGRLKHYLLNQGETKFLYERPTTTSSTSSTTKSNKSMHLRVFHFLCYLAILLSVSAWLTMNIDSVSHKLEVVRNLSTPVIESVGQALNDTKTYDRYIYYWHHYSKLPYCILVYVFSISALLFANPITKPNKLVRAHWVVWALSLVWFLVRFVYNLQIGSLKSQEYAIIPDFDLLLIPIILAVNLVSYTSSVTPETTQPTLKTMNQSRTVFHSTSPVFHGLRKPLFEPKLSIDNPFSSNMAKKTSILNHSESESESDDDSSIVSGLTNLYLNRTRARSTRDTTYQSVYSNKTFVQGAPTQQKTTSPDQTASWIKLLLVLILVVILTLQFF